jgi:hypothetical protein
MSVNPIATRNNQPTVTIGTNFEEKVTKVFSSVKMFNAASAVLDKAVTEGRDGVFVELNESDKIYINLSASTYVYMKKTGGE